MSEDASSPSSSPSSSRSAEEHELEIALDIAASEAPFFVAGSQRLGEPLKLFLTAGDKAAAAPAASSSGICDSKCIVIGADGLQEDALQALLQVGGLKGAQDQTGPARVRIPCWEGNGQCSTPPRQH